MRPPLKLTALALLLLTVSASAASVERFSIDEKAVTLKVPDVPASGKPWLWVGEFAGHLKSLEDGLVEKGWHVAYISFSNQFGSPASMQVWDKLYEELHDKRGLSAKPALLGISRGGLYANAWVRLHPDRVSVLYLDNAVGDIRSWPGGFQLQAKGKGGPNDWQLYKNVFGFTDDTEAQQKSIRPADGLLPALKNDVFLISVHGTADTVVPYEDNAGIIVDFWQKQGGRLKIFPKEGGDHHPHGLPDPKPLIELLCSESK
jgi:pimeloyl-ACP methyl ester carboxylesterase